MMKKTRWIFCALLAALMILPSSMAYAEGETPDPAGPKSAELVVVGDLMALSSQIRSARKSGYDFRYAFKYVKPIISGADLAIGNFETPVAGGKYPYCSGKRRNGYPLLNAPETYAAAVADAGFDVVSTANNHSLDYGEKGLLNTLAVLKKYGIATAGTYATPQERALPLIKDVNGIKIAVLAYTNRTNKGERRLSKAKRAYMYNLLTPRTTGIVAKDIKTAKDAGAEIVIVMVHWGSENTRRINSAQRTMAAKIAAAGADIIALDATFRPHPGGVSAAELIAQVKTETNCLVMADISTLA